MDVVIEVPQVGKAIQFGRFNQGGAMDIFPSVAGSESLEGTGEMENEGKRKTIKAEFSIGLRELAEIVLHKDEELDDINRLTDEPSFTLESCSAKLCKEIPGGRKSKVLVRYAIYKDKDSANLGSRHDLLPFALFEMKKLKKVAGPNQLFYHEWKARKSNCHPPLSFVKRRNGPRLKSRSTNETTDSDEVNPNYLSGITTTHLLSELLQQKIDLEYHRAKELAARG